MIKNRYQVNYIYKQEDSHSVYCNKYFFTYAYTEEEALKEFLDKYGNLEFDHVYWNINLLIRSFYHKYLLKV